VSGVLVGIFVVFKPGAETLMYLIKFPISSPKLYLRPYRRFLVGDAINLDVTPTPVPRPGSVAAVRIKRPSLCQD
jgi:hypothetical protein